ncbi:MAG: LPXTG cell wall anchor domain-containing protein [Salinibacterium sp.]|nr:LPXTG cell wall anchor domain-containing protein [Salinibacterium sp.]MBF0671202.1 LPXTG cell wall anchor domain-containing protein [Salinibacterium sp.]
MTSRNVPGLRRAAVVAGLSMTAIVLGASPASAADSYDEAVTLSWDGSSYAATTTVTFFGVPVSVPGDSAERTVQVRNDGTTGGILTARIVNVKLRTPDEADIHHNPGHRAPDSSGLYGGAGDQGNIYDDILVGWSDGSASLSTLDANGTTPVMSVPLARGESTPLVLNYDFAVASTAGNEANVDLREASFDVEIQIGGDDSAAQPPVGPPGFPGLPVTGSELVWLLVGGGATLIAAGSVAIVAGRRRRAR